MMIKRQFFSPRYVWRGFAYVSQLNGKYLGSLLYFDRNHLLNPDTPNKLQINSRFIGTTPDETLEQMKDWFKKITGNSTIQVSDL